MTAYTLKELSNSKDSRVSDIAKRLLKDKFPEAAQFEITLRQIDISAI